MQISFISLFFIHYNNFTQRVYSSTNLFGSVCINFLCTCLHFKHLNIKKDKWYIPSLNKKILYCYNYCYSNNILFCYLHIRKLDARMHQQSNSIPLLFLGIIILLSILLLFILNLLLKEMKYKRNQEEIEPIMNTH